MPSAAVHRADSTRSDNSDASGRSAESRGSAGKKVSFSRAVRVKKFPRRHEGSSNSVAHAGNGDVVDSAQVPPSPEKKFWFKVYKNRHHHDKTAGGSRVAEEQPLPVETTVSDSSGHHHHHHARGTSSVARSASSASASRSPRRRPDSPVVKRNHVRRIVQKFDREATLRHDLPASSSRESSPPPPPIPPPPSVVRSYSVEEYTRPGTPIELQRSPAPKRSNRLVDGVKVILAPLTRKKSSASKKEARSAGTGTLVREEDFEEVNNNENKENEPVEEEEEMPVMVDKATQVKPFDLEEFFATSGDVSHLYSQVDKSKKTTTFKTPEIHVHHPEVVVDYPITSSPRYVDDRDYEYYERSRASSSSPTLRRGGDVSTTPEPEYGSIRRVKSSSRSFGFNLGPLGARRQASRLGHLQHQQRAGYPESRRRKQARQCAQGLRLQEARAELRERAGKGFGDREVPDGFADHVDVRGVGSGHRQGLPSGHGRRGRDRAQQRIRVHVHRVAGRRPVVQEEDDQVGLSGRVAHLARQRQPVQDSPEVTVARTAVRQLRPDFGSGWPCCCISGKAGESSRVFIQRPGLQVLLASLSAGPGEPRSLLGRRLRVGARFGPGLGGRLGHQRAGLPAGHGGALHSGREPPRDAVRELAARLPQPVRLEQGEQELVVLTQRLQERPQVQVLLEPPAEEGRLRERHTQDQVYTEGCQVPLAQNQADCNGDAGALATLRLSRCCGGYSLRFEVH
ncbi:hypothetical protein MTO96_025032 [Rhipicephalus appendiculatus]